LLALKHLADTNANEVVRSQARGALWILEGKEQMTSAAASASHVSLDTTGLKSTLFTASAVSLTCNIDVCVTPVI